MKICFYLQYENAFLKIFLRKFDLSKTSFKKWREKLKKALLFHMLE
jgi:hypothetical protein